MSHELAASFFKKRAPAPVPFPSENETHRASSSLVAIKLSNIKVGCEAPGMFNYNLDIICAVQLRSSVKCISLFAQKRWKGGWLTSDETCIKWKEAWSLSEWQSYKDSGNSKALALLDISVGIRINYHSRWIKHYFNGAIASLYQQHYINNCYRVGIWARESSRTKTVAFLTKRSNLSQWEI